MYSSDDSDGSITTASSIEMDTYLEHAIMNSNATRNIICM